jgi:hypothetical protein
MAHFALINENNVVNNIVVIDNEHEDYGQEYLAETLGFGGTWIQTSYNTRAGEHLNGGTPLRKNYAIIGGVYDPTRDAFYRTQPFPSWVLNEETCLWEAPVSRPEDESKLWNWDEEAGNWVETTLENLQYI